MRLDGGDETVFKRSAARADSHRVVSVKMHHFRRRPDRGVMELIYSVSLSGSTVDAVAAAHDMNYVTDNEVSTRLGFPVLTKAERQYRIAFNIFVETRRFIFYLFFCKSKVKGVEIATFIFFKVVRVGQVPTFNSLAAAPTVIRPLRSGSVNTTAQNPLLVETSNGCKITM